MSAACSQRFGPPRAPELRLSTNPDVRWETDGPHDLAVILENTGAVPTALPEPSPAYASVVVFDPADAGSICRKDAAQVAESPELVDLAGRERRALVVRLDTCEIVPGEYRYEASYVIPEVPGSRWSGRLGPEHGRIVVQSSGALIDWPASRSAVSPPGHADAPGPPAPANPHFRRAVPPLGPASLACVDRELAGRGLNAWGDPAATVYPEGPPTLASEVERQKMVLERYPEIANSCRIPP
jgi:hypothetical protein